MKAFRITLAKDDEDLAVALLWDTGTAGLETLAANLQPEGGPVQLLAYFSDDRPLAAVEEALVLLPEAAVVPAEIPDVDWVARFRETFSAFGVGRFRLAPSWDSGAALEAGPAREQEPSIHLVVDPGRAFGTGTHETTRLCLLALQELAPEQTLGSVVDIGTGTGILSVAALRLGAVRAVAVDLDSEATASARLHARLNDTPLLVVQADGGRALQAGRFDLVLANLTAPLLLERCAELLQLARPGATLVLSGLLLGDLPRVQRAYEVAGPTEVRTHGEWAAILIRKPA